MSDNFNNMFKSINEEQKQRLGITDEELLELINKQREEKEINMQIEKSKPEEPQSLVDARESMVAIFNDDELETANQQPKINNVEQKQEEIKVETPSVKNVSVEAKLPEEPQSLVDAREAMLASFKDDELETAENVSVEAKKPEEIKPKKENIEQKSQPKRLKTKDDVLKSIEINLEDFENNILDNYSVDNFDLFKGMNLNINGRPTSETVCSQSGYVAHMEGLRYQDLLNIQNSTGGLAASKERIYKTIYSKINTTTFGNIDYSTFKKITSIFDEDSLIYGIYTQTFSDETQFTIKCAHCGENIPVKFKNEQLIRVKGEDIQKRIEETVRFSTNPKEAIKTSMLSVNKRILLPESKMVIDCRIPSIENQLEIMSKLNMDRVRSIAEIVNLIYFIKDMYEVDLGSALEGKAKFVKVKSKEQFIPKLCNLSINDEKYFNEELGNFIYKHRVMFAVPSIKCPACENPTGDIELNMEDMLFMRTAE